MSRPGSEGCEGRSGRSLWDEAGGEPEVRSLLQDLYDALFDDVMVGFLFVGKDKTHIVEQQVRFAAGFLGGPSELAYTGKPLPEAHVHLPLLPGHFDRRHELLRRTLESHRVPEGPSVEWLRVDRALRSTLLKGSESARARGRTGDGTS